MADIPEFLNLLNQYVNEYANDRRLSRTAIAEKIGITKGPFSRWLTGDNRIPLEQFVFLIKVLELEQTKEEKLIKASEYEAAIEAIRSLKMVGSQLPTSPEEWLQLPDVVKLIENIREQIIAATPPPTPLQRPPQVEHFVGREDELNQLLQELKPGCFITLCGFGGVGKTALACEAVRRLAPNDTVPDRFPDGVIYHTFLGNPKVDHALEHIARSFGEEPQPDPETGARRALAGRKALLILGEAELCNDLDKILGVRDQCGLLVTSRDRHKLGGKRYDVNVLPKLESVTLIRSWAGMSNADDATLVRIAYLVGFLPFALCLIGKYLDQSGETPAQYLDWLQAQPLDALNQGDRISQSVPLLIKHSLAAVSEDARNIIGMIGFLQAYGFDGHKVAEILNRDIRRPLSELTRYGFLVRSNTGWYYITHTLVYIYTSRVSEFSRPSMEPLFNKFIAEITEMLDEDESYFEKFRASQDIARRTGQKYPFDRSLLYRTKRPHRDPWLAPDIEAPAIPDELFLDPTATNEKKAFAYTIRGIEYRARGEDEKAIADWTKAIELAPDFAYVYYNRGSIYFHQGQYEKALADYTKAIELAPNSGLAYLDRGIYYRVRGDYEKAIADWTKAIELDPDFAFAYLVYCERGDVYHHQGEDEKALADYSKALELAPDFAYVYGKRGNVYHHQGEDEKALADYSKALELAPDFAYVYYNRGSIYFYRGQYENALADYTKAKELAPDSYPNYYDQGIMYYQQGRHEEALVHYTRTIELAPDSHLDYYNRGIMYYQQGEYENALADFTRAIELASDSALAYNNRANVYEDQGEYENALADYTKAIEFASDFALAYQGRGSVYYHQANYEKALEDYRQALTIDSRGDISLFYKLTEELRHQVKERIKELERQG